MPLRFIVLMTLCLAAITPAQSATQVAQRPAAPVDVAREQQIRRWLTDLADPQATLRERAREELMGLKAKELATLRAAVQEAKSLEPSQAAALREIVTQVYLAAQPYERSDSGFVGIKMAAPSADEPVGVPSMVGPGMQVIVDSRLPGFPGYRWLRDGDVILDIEERPMPQPMGTIAFTNAISDLMPGTRVHLKVLRQAKVIRVLVLLGAKPAERIGEGVEYPLRVDAMLHERTVQAEKYWKENFASLVETSAKE